MGSSSRPAGHCAVSRGRSPQGVALPGPPVLHPLGRFCFSTSTTFKTRKTFSAVENASCFATMTTLTTALPAKEHRD